MPIPSIARQELYSAHKYRKNQAVMSASGNGQFGVKKDLIADDPIRADSSDHNDRKRRHSASITSKQNTYFFSTCHTSFRKAAECLYPMRLAAYSYR